MSCPIHDRCTCYPQYTASVTSTSMGSPQFAQTNNILVGYEWAAPLVTSSAAWCPLESVIIQPPTLCSGQEILQSDCLRLGNIHEALPLHSAYRRESRVHDRGQKQASFREPVRLSRPHIPLCLCQVSSQPNIRIPHHTSKEFLACQWLCPATYRYFNLIEVARLALRTMTGSRQSNLR
jgi:hypothetical protein